MRTSGAAPAGNSSSSACSTAAQPAGPIMLHNRCPLALLCGQVGTQECIELPNGASRPYTWLAAPGLDPLAQRLLHIAGLQMAPSKDAPSTAASAGEQELKARSGDGLARQDGVGLHQPEKAAGAEDIAWSKPFEAMARSTALVTVRTPGGLCTMVATSATQVSDLDRWLPG